MLSKKDLNANYGNKPPFHWKAVVQDSRTWKFGGVGPEDSRIAEDCCSPILDQRHLADICI